MSVLPCTCHPERAAVSRCERCNRNICLDDKVIHRKRRSSWTAEHRRTWVETYEYCPVCKSEVEIEEVSESIIGNIILIVFGILFFIIATGAAVPFFSLMGILVVGFGVVTIMSSLAKEERARLRQQQFLSSLKGNVTGVGQNPAYRPGRIGNYLSRKKISAISMTCFQCGGAIELTDDYCTSWVTAHRTNGTIAA